MDNHIAGVNFSDTPLKFCKMDKAESDYCGLADCKTELTSEKRACCLYEQQAFLIL